MENMKNNNNQYATSILKGVGISLISTIILLLIFSIILTYSNIQENVIEPVIMIITAISILIGSSLGNTRIKKNGLVNGAIVGRNLYYNNIFNIKYIKLEIFSKYAIYNNDYN